MADAADIFVLDEDAIAELLQGARTKGAGDDVLTAFLNSGHAGIRVDLSTGPLAGKNADQAAAALNNAKKKMKENDKGEMVPVHPEASQVVVRKVKGKDENDPGSVFLIDKSKYVAA